MNEYEKAEAFLVQGASTGMLEGSEFFIYENVLSGNVMKELTGGRVGIKGVEVVVLGLSG